MNSPTAYWIKGDDGEEYGPVGTDELREWAVENRVGIGTSVRKGGADDAWRPWQEFPELVALLAEAETIRRRRRSPFPGVPGLRLGGLLARVVAFTIDLFVINILSGVLFGLSQAVIPERWRIDPDQMMQAAWANQPLSLPEALVVVGVLILIVAYFTLMHGRSGQTVGKKLLRLRVVNEDGLTIGYRTAFFRAIGTLLSILPYFAGFLLAFFSPKRRALHDVLAGTYVAAVERPRRENNRP